MSDNDSRELVVLTVAGAVAVGLLGATVVLLSGKQQHASAPAPVPVPVMVEPIKINWLGGPSDANIKALAYMFASENDSASPLVWALQALCANNFSRQLARKNSRISSIADMLQSGIDKSQVPHRRVYNLGWGRQWDKKTKIVRFAATDRGRDPLSITWPKFEMAARLLANRIDIAALKGRRGESAPEPREWISINSFLQYESFGEIVQRQAGDAAEKDPDVVVASWGKTRLVASVEGLRFFAVGT